MSEKKCCENCVKKGCPEPIEKPELGLPVRAIVPAGKYENVDIEIDENGKIISLKPANKIIVRGCDSCA